MSSTSSQLRVRMRAEGAANQARNQKEREADDLEAQRQELEINMEKHKLDM